MTCKPPRITAHKTYHTARSRVSRHKWIQWQIDFGVSYTDNVSYVSFAIHRWCTRVKIFFPVSNSRNHFTVCNCLEFRSSQTYLDSDYVIQIKYGLPYCVTCPSMSTDPWSLNPGARRSRVHGWWGPGIRTNIGAGDTNFANHTWSVL